jgi:phosphatidylethanolamine-binding protein (PEBP) family uncharacterized protein
MVGDQSLRQNFACLHDPRCTKGSGKLAFHDGRYFGHGGSTFPYDDSGRVPEGAIDYIGSCPPAGTLHRYVWTIEALDKSGKIVSHTTAEARFLVS